MKLVCLTHNRVFKTITKAVADEEFRNLTASNIIRCCKGEISSTGKDSQGNRLQWCYFKDYISHKHFPCVEAELGNWVVCLTDGRIFSNSKEACSFYNIEPARISMQLAGSRPSAGYDSKGRKLVFIKFLDLKGLYEGDSND